MSVLCRLASVEIHFYQIAVSNWQPLTNEFFFGERLRNETGNEAYHRPLWFLVSGPASLLGLMWQDFCFPDYFPTPINRAILGMEMHTRIMTDYLLLNSGCDVHTYFVLMEKACLKVLNAGGEPWRSCH